MSEPSQTLLRRFQKAPSDPLYSEFLSALDNISGPPVWVVNDVDSEPCPRLVFKWVDEYHFGTGVPSRDEQFSIGCSCPGDECDLRDPGSCECLEDAYEKRFSYDVDGLVHHPPGLPIIECSSRCGCGRTCPNRVVQRGRRMPLEIFKTHNKGWGTHHPSDIKRQLICQEYGLADRYRKACSYAATLGRSSLKQKLNVEEKSTIDKYAATLLAISNDDRELRTCSI
jgi:hypothetical protein